MKQIVTSGLYLLVLFAVSTFVFDPSHLYYEIKWLDIPMHIMGGFGVASLVIALYAYNEKTVSFKTLFIIYTFAAIAWELYEYVRALTSYASWDGWLDSLKDYIDGLIGTYLAYLLIKKNK